MQFIAGQYGRGNFTTHDDYLVRPDVDLGRVPFVSGHFGYAFARPLLPGRYAFTFLRDPIERLLSFYSFCLSHSPVEHGEFFRLVQSVSFDRFLEMAIDSPNNFSHVWNNQTWMLAHGWGVSGCFDDFSEDELVRLAIRHLEDFSHVGFTETFERDAHKILGALGIAPRGRLERHNVTPNRLRADTLSQATRKLMDRLTALDRHVYEHAWSAYSGAAAPRPAR